MAKIEQSVNPYAPPSAPVNIPPTAELVQGDDPLHDTLTRAFYAATYGTVFFPGLGYCVALFLLFKVAFSKQEFSPAHRKLFDTTVMICWLLSPPMFAVAVIFSLTAIGVI